MQAKAKVAEARLAEAVKHFFFQIRAKDASVDPNVAAVQAVEKARAWVSANGLDAPFPG